MKFSISVVLDTIFCWFITFILLCFLFSTFVERNLTLIISVTLSLIFSLAYFKLFLNLDKRNSIKKAEKRQYEQTMFSLSLMTYKTLIDFFYRVLSVKYSSVNKNDRYVTVNQTNSVIFFNFNPDGVKKSDLIKAYNHIEENQTAIIYAPSFSNEITAYAKNFNGKILLNGGKEVFSLLKEVNLFPQTVITPLSLNNKAKLTTLLDKKRAKTFSIFGLTFALYSFLVPIKIYYLVIGCSFLVFALVLKLFGKKSPA